MSKLTETFKKLNKVACKKGSLKILKEQFESENKDNEVLKQYIKILADIAKQDKNLTEFKDIMYELMLADEIDDLQGDFCNVTLVKPYTKQVINTKLFMQENKPDSRLYKKYVSMDEVKGHAKIKLLEDK